MFVEVRPVNSGMVSRQFVNLATIATIYNEGANGWWLLDKNDQWLCPADQARFEAEVINGQAFITRPAATEPGEP